MKQIGKLWLLAATLLLLAACSQTEAPELDALAKPSGPELETLAPGEKVEITQNLDVNVVFVGFEEDKLGEGFEAWLPDSYEAVQRYPSFYTTFYGGDPVYMGTNFTFNFDTIYADEGFEDDLFTYLASIGEVNDPTIFQQCYSGTAPEGTTACTNQASNDLVIEETLYIDAPSVEQWLIANASDLGVDPTEYTIFYINWYGSEEVPFQFHVYTKTDEGAIDPDTDYNFGEERDSRKLMAWGGAPTEEDYRVWFYDLSAGPDSNTDNWNVDDADLDPDAEGATQYRISPIWEYEEFGGAADSWWQDVADGELPWVIGDVATDLSLVTRFVAIDLLFTTSPLYDPALSPPALPDSIQVDINLYDIADQCNDPNDCFKLDVIAEELEKLRPYNDFTAEIEEADFKARAAQIYRCFIIDQSCFGNRLGGYAGGDLFLFANSQIVKFLEGDADYELPVFAYYDEELLAAGGLLGFADDDYMSGTQSYLFEFLDPYLFFLGYGFTATTVHEAGHHVGISHPHDGYDSGFDIDFGPSDAFYFAWLGDEVDSVMSYLGLSINFSQFDRDNMNRFMTVTYLNYANAILERIYRSPRVNRVSDMLTEADALAAQAIDEYLAMDYEAAAFTAEAAYRMIFEAAEAINIKVEPQAWQADYKSQGSSVFFIDQVNGAYNRPH